MNTTKILGKALSGIGIVTVALLTALIWILVTIAGIITGMAHKIR